MVPSCFSCFIFPSVFCSIFLFSFRTFGVKYLGDWQFLQHYIHVPRNLFASRQLVTLALPCSSVPSFGPLLGTGRKKMVSEPPHLGGIHIQDFISPVVPVIPMAQHHRGIAVFVKTRIPPGMFPVDDDDGPERNRGQEKGGAPKFYPSCCSVLQVRGESFFVLAPAPYSIVRNKCHKPDAPCHELSVSNAAAG